ncbi:Uu.00g121870.m01.CDS01 [Anthostomella pinea]|uniref:Uu.00g121870.m01.CDS01 n=1 Tax=Anthostomella pinea TaxID=933095 RepID=A0AAI8VH08_9PEZI|nr:Uu.00g121870.m01.CDS01 [Anthostomella pinea]
MPYNTRRKSLSLPSLGIRIPVHRASTNSNMAASRSSSESSPHPNKKLKRSHNHSASSGSLTSVSGSKSKSAAAPVKFDQTPPPSPRLQVSIEMDESEAHDAPEVKPVDLEGINDDIVEAVIVRLQQTRNRPHLVKELASVLMNNVKIVQQSANPCAIISSRLATYLKRSGWSALAPCPLAKELETVHPRRTYFYLTTCPHLPMPDPLSAQRSAIITPELSSSASTSEDADGDRRRELSLSPEVDLSSPEFDGMEEDIPMPGTPMGSVSGRQRALHSMSRNHRGEEPPLEKDEKEFTQTADGLQKRKASGELLSATPADQVVIDDGMQNEQLFGEPHRTLAPSLLPRIAFMTSPAMRPSLMIPAKRDAEAENWSKLDAMLDWDKSPETVELDELDGLLNGF